MELSNNRKYGVYINLYKTMEYDEIKENIEWIRCPKNNTGDLKLPILCSWVKIGLKKTSIASEIRFCEPNNLEKILMFKTMLDHINKNEFMWARSRCNKFEKIGRSIFQNRSAVKMANLDAILNFILTDPKNENCDSASNEILYFADVCAGPGGFSEYVLWRKKLQAKGFGFTLRNECDFNMDVLPRNTDVFQTFYGANGDGNIFDPANIDSIERFVLSQTYNSGVQLMMADGGFYVKNENTQEIASKQLYLCQCLVALSIVKVHGCFVLKLFDCFSDFTVGLLYLMYRCFEQICIVKPNSSRPANSERYLVCKHKRENTDSLKIHLFNINVRIWSGFGNDTYSDINELVPLEVLNNDHVFFNYIVNSNTCISNNQIYNLEKILSFINDPTRAPIENEELIRNCCLLNWKLDKKQVTIFFC